LLTCILKSRALGTAGYGRRSPVLPVLCAALIAGLTACANYRAPQYDPWPEVVYSDEPAQTPVPPPPPAAALDAERHAFAIPDSESVVGTLGTIVLRQGDTLSDVARHFGLGYEEIVAANPDLDPWVIGHPTRALLPLRFVLPPVPRRGIVINLAAMRLYHYPASRHASQAVTYPIGIGREGRATPTGGLSIVRKTRNPTWRPTRRILNDHLQRGDPLPAVVPPGPDNPLGAYAMYLSAPQYLIHGTNKPYTVGLRASNGCIRLYPEDVEALFPTVPVREPVTIVNQPYLIGTRGGTYYLQAYRPHEEVNEPAARQRVRDELKKLETEHRLAVDWKRVERILNETRGIPFPIAAQTPDVETVLASATELPHPATFYGQPSPPPDDPSGWHVVAAESDGELAARRTVAILQHLGLPARLEGAGGPFRIVAGPFADAKKAQRAATQMKGDFELDSQVLAPDTERAGGIAPPLSPMPEAQSPEPAGPETSGPVDTWQPPASEAGPAEVPIPYQEAPAEPSEAPPLEFPPDMDIAPSTAQPPPEAGQSHLP
jgi:L,D-transpeptidase ErfK/SrfK